VSADNVLKGVTATQSSTLHAWTGADKAVDGG